MRLLNTLLLLFAQLVLFGQNPLKKADIIFDNFGYQTSIPLFKQAIYDQSGAINLKNLERIAHSCRLVHDTENAEKWYAELIKHSSVPINYLYYAQSLQSNGKFDLAKQYYLLYDKAYGGNDKRGALLAAAIDRIPEFKKEAINIQNVTTINSEKLDFSPTYYQNGIVFVSNRKIQPYYFPENNKDIWLDEGYMSLFSAEKQLDGTLKQPKSFSINLTTRYHEGPLCFSKDGQQIFFTRNNYLKGKKTLSKSGVIRLKILTATKKGNDWANIEALSFNTDEYDECHPTLSSDGKKLIFASNRPGGFGGMDLYSVTFSNGLWGVPLNLGPTINTAGNEVFPFIHDDGTLYFASNGLGGLGGLDIFSSQQIDGIWQESLNLGTPINSTKDDFGFILNVLSTEGYLSSARENNTGKDDIYSFSIEPETLKKKFRTQFHATICVFDKKELGRIENSAVRMYEKLKDGTLESQYGNRITRLIPINNSGEYILKSVPKSTKSNFGKEIYHTNQLGEFVVTLESDREYVFIAEKEGYKTAQKSFTTEGLSAIDTLSFCIPIESDKKDCVNIEGIVVNKVNGNRIPNANVLLKNQCTGLQTIITSNLLGEFHFYCLPQGCDFQLAANKETFYSVTKNLPKKDFDNITVAKKYELQLFSKNESDLSSNTSIITEGNDNTIKEGTIIELADIYYDFDDYHIRADAKLILDKLVGLLRQYPSMEIELTAHTDSRGRDKYNERLSDNRAKYALRYLVNKGINSSRLKYKGEGENFLRNHCKNGISCSESAHQYNRRTEVKVTKFDQKDVKLNNF